ncbi:MAG: hypothetical protein LC797_14625 [Chloroflexi bacterium]|nr:hypothetical protein [Chloroflexota bacterium]
MSTMAIGCWLGAFTSDQALAVGVQPLHFARRLFGRKAVEYQVRRVQQYLKSVGYGPTSADHPGFVTALATLMLRTGRVELAAMTIEVIEAAHRDVDPEWASRGSGPAAPTTRASLSPSVRRRHGCWRTSGPSQRGTPRSRRSRSRGGRSPTPNSTPRCALSPTSLI